MKFLIASAIAALLLSGCIAVPYAPAAAPAAYYYPPVPAATVNFGYVYRDGGRWRGRHH